MGCHPPTDEREFAAQAIEGDVVGAAATGSIVSYQVFTSSRSVSPGFCFRILPEIRAVAVGPDDDLWIAGTFIAPLAIGDATLVSAGGADVFVARLDPSGNPRWSVRLGAAGQDECKGFALDAEGNVIVAYQPPPGAQVVTLAKLDSSGIVRWQKDVLPSLDHYGHELVEVAAADGSGGMLLVGSFDGAYQAGASILRSSHALVRFDANGEVEWSTGLHLTSDDVAVGVVLDGLGRAVIAGDNSNGAGFGLEAIDRSGQRLWQKRVTSTSDQDIVLASMAAAPQGDILLSGGGHARFPGLPRDRVRGGAWLTKLDPSGKLLWQVPSEGRKVVLDGAGSVLSTSGSSATKLDSTGAVVWRWTTQVVGDARAGAVAIDPVGRLIVAGSFQGSYDFGKGSVQSGSEPALFIAKFAP